jgi:hypothetical protein
MAASLAPVRSFQDRSDEFRISESDPFDPPCFVRWLIEIGNYSDLH